MVAPELQHVAWAAACLACTLAGIEFGQTQARADEATLHAVATGIATAAIAHTALTGQPTPSCAPDELARCVGDLTGWHTATQATFWIEADAETTGFTVYGIRHRDQRQVFHRVAGRYPAR